MPPPILPWIERMILNYGVAAGTDNTRPKAHVLGMGHKSDSQARENVVPPGMVWLSDEAIQIPAVLSLSIWNELQDQEERDGPNSLLNTTVCLHEYQLEFHMDPESTRCRFYLTVTELATTSAGQVYHNAPCSTMLESVRTKIFKTWRSRLGRNDTQQTQCGIQLSGLLGDWHHNHLLTVMNNIEKTLTLTRKSPQPGTSTSDPSVAVTATGWDLDRIRFKGLEPFVVPVKQLLIPEHLQQKNRQEEDDDDDDDDGGGVKGERSVNRNTLVQSEDSAASVREAERRVSVPGVQTSVPQEDTFLHEGPILELLDMDITPLSNPWDMFPRPCDTSSSSDASSQPAEGPQDSTRRTVFTSTQLPVHASETSQQPSLSKAEHSLFPPYQKPPPSSSNSTYRSPSASSAPGLTEPSNPPMMVQDRKTDVGLTDGSKPRKAKRKRCDLDPEMLCVLVEEEHVETQVSSSPPSWLFESQARSKEGGACGQGPPIRKQTPTVHSDGRPFSYTYQVSGDNQRDLSRFRVEEPLVHWAVKYLVVPKDADQSRNASGPAVSGGTEVSSV